MSWIPLLNNEPYTITTDDLPALIHGEKGAGSSLFSTGLLSQLYFQGEPLLIISSRPEVKEEFLKQTDAQEKFREITTEQEIAQAQDQQVVYVSSDHNSLLPTLLATLEDFTERTVFIHKFDEINKETVALFYGHQKTIYVGDLNISEAKEPLLQLKYMTKIFFSPLHNDFRLTLPPMEQYHGYYQGRTDTGTVFLREENS